MMGGSAGELSGQAHRKFICMAATFSLGVFNDNFYKQAAMLLAVSAGRPEMQGYALVIFTLPFVLLAAPAGWMADRFSKSQVVIGAKCCELIAMLCGAVGICTGHWPLIFIMLAIMGAQATFLSPALNGSIPELYPEGYIMRANALLRVTVTLAILGGVAMGGLALDVSGVG
ncbi:MAG: MFS transporter, partial [Syntrophales bacterium]